MPIDHFPKKIRPAAYRLRDWAMTAGPASLYVSTTSFAIGGSYGGLFGECAREVHPIEALVSAVVWAALWCVVSGLAALVSFGVLDRGVVGRAVFLMWSILSFVWASSWFVSWAQGAADRGLARATWYGVSPILVAWALWMQNRLYGIVEAQRSDACAVLRAEMDWGGCK